MGPTWVLSAPDGPHDGPMNLAIRVGFKGKLYETLKSETQLPNLQVLQCASGQC